MHNLEEVSRVIFYWVWIIVGILVLYLAVRGVLLLDAIGAWFESYSNVFD